MLKPRLADADQRATAQRVLAHVLDNLLRLLHPMTPFITEEVWQLLNQFAPQRGLAAPSAGEESVMIAPWPACDAARIDAEAEARFARFQAVLVALRDIRARNNIAPKDAITFALECDGATADLLKPMTPYFEAMARATATAWGAKITPPATSARASLPGIEVYVDLQDFIDIPAEIARHEAESAKLAKAIAAKESKLANESFVRRAPAAVVEQERASLVQLREQLSSVARTLEKLKSA
jgi:valyl-tRNA synthetase